MRADLMAVLSSPSPPSSSLTLPPAQPTWGQGPAAGASHASCSSLRTATAGPTHLTRRGEEGRGWLPRPTVHSASEDPVPDPQGSLASSDLANIPARLGFGLYVGRETHIGQVSVDDTSAFMKAKETTEFYTKITPVRVWPESLRRCLRPRLSLEDITGAAVSPACV